ncbi:MAG: BamA/TamA family outer membrane protein [Chlamydiota bacterium]
MKSLKAVCIAFILFLSPGQTFGVEAYTVDFQGVTDENLLQLMHAASQLIILQNSPPTTNVGLRRRAESDLNNIVKVLHSQAFYNAKITINYDFQKNPVVITINVDKGPRYPIEEFLILPDPKSNGSFSYSSISLQEIDVCIGQPAYTETIISAENKLEELMNDYGYPYASVTDREVIADQESKAISVVIFISSGPKVQFGRTSISGNCCVRDRFFRKKISWKSGQTYSPCLVQQTQNELELSNLFTSVSIVLPDEPPEEDGEVPITIQVNESKPRSIGFGINYETNRGPGFGGNWEHRNLTGIGDKFTAKGDIWYDKQFGRMSYIVPDWGRKKQKLIWSADYLREIDVGYHEKSYSFGATVARPVNCYLQFAYGLLYQHLINTDIHEKKRHQRQKTDDETFNLFKSPVSFFWNHSNSILDPTSGYRLKLRSTPSYNFTGKQVYYDTNLMSASYYHPFDGCHRFVLAGQVTLGLIFGPQKDLIPRSELFDAGTDKLLRGYKYKTVSPLDNEFKPTGGRSMMIYSLEYRYRQSQDIGWVLFWDFGNVYANRLPELNKKILHSVGLGFRYFTPVGPIRLDLAFPLDRRRHVDKSEYQAYLSFGQAF